MRLPIARPINPDQQRPGTSRHQIGCEPSGSWRTLDLVNATSIVAGALRRSSGQAVWLLSVGHAVDDLYQGSVPALIPFFVATRHWDYAAVSGLTVAATLLSSVVQPIFGVITDRRHLWWLVPLGMGLAGVGIGLSGLTRSYLLTWLAIALSGLGVAAFHPESARLARFASRGSHVGMSWYSMGGNVGYALGPLVVGALLGTLGTGATLPLLIPALVCAGVTALALRSANRNAATRPARSSARGGADDWPGFIKLTTVVVARSIAVFGLGTFLALYVEHRLHGGPALGEAALLTLYALGALGTLLGGRLAGRFGRVRVVRASYLLGIPSLAAVWLLSGPYLFIAIAAIAITFYVPFSLHVTLGQDYLPSRLGTASGVTLGLAITVGGLASPLIGLIAQASSLRLAIATLTVMPLIATVVAFRMLEPRPSVVAVAPAAG